MVDVNSYCCFLVDKETTHTESKPASAESPTGGESGVCEAYTTPEPCLGMVFESEDAAKVFYDEYARRVGFFTRIISSRKSERDGSVISRQLACNKEGFNRRKTSGRVQFGKRESIREGCRAMILVKKEKPGRWVVTKFEKEHNHPLLSTSENNRPTTDEKDMRIRELSSELHRTNQKLEACREHLQIVMTYIEEHAKGLSKTIEEAVKDIKEVESKRQKAG